MENFLLFILLFGLLFQITSYFRVRFFEIFLPLAFPLLTFYLLKTVESFELINNDVFLVQRNIIIGLGFSFFISNLFSLFDKEKKNINLLVFIYYGLANVLVFLNNIFHIFIVLELLTVLGAIFVVIDSSTKDYRKLKDIATGYFITHCFSGMIFLVGLSFISNSNYPTFLLSSLTSENISVGYVFIVISLLINIAVPIFSSWLVQGYSNCRFSLSFILYAVVTKVSVFFLSLIAPLTNLEQIIMLIGFVTMCYGSIMTVIESNVKKFIAYATISHNGVFILMISEITKIGITDFYHNFGNFIFSSVIVQNLVLGIMYTITYNSNSYFFVDVEKNIAKYKLLFLLVLISSFIYIGMPLTPAFQFKDLIFRNLNTAYQLIFYFTTIISIFSHLFIYPFKIFKNKDINFSTNFFSPTEYIRNLSIVLITIVYILFATSIYIPASQDMHKYIQLIVASGIIFILSYKLLGKSRKITLDFDFLFYQFKSILSDISSYWENMLNKIYEYSFSIFKATLASMRKIVFFNTYNSISIILLLFTLYVVFFIYL